MAKLLNPASSLLIVIDAQEKLMPAINGADEIIANIAKLITGAHYFELPVLLMEQYPEGLGPVVAPLKEADAGRGEVIAKTSFSSAGSPLFTKAIGRLSQAGRSQLILTGAEAHVCVLQSALDLIAHGHEVYVVADGIGSRKQTSHDLALKRLEAAGATLVTTEMVLFEWIGRSDTQAFKALRSLLV